MLRIQKRPGSGALWHCYLGRISAGRWPNSRRISAAKRDPLNWTGDSYYGLLLGFGISKKFPVLKENKTHSVLAEKLAESGRAKNWELPGKK